MKRFFYFLFVLLLSSTCYGQSETKMNSSPLKVNQWIAKHFAKGQIPPFSFDYGGRPSKEFITKWKYSAIRLVSDDPYVLKYSYTYRDPATGLKVTCDVKGFTDYPAVEWVLQLSNEGNKNTPEIANVCTSNVSFKYTQPGDFNIRYSEGSTAAKSDFCPHLKVLSQGDNFIMKPEEGRSSSGKFLPFYNIESKSKQGIIVGIGWTGTWFSNLKRSDNRSISLTSGIEKLKTYLYPAESIRTSSICMLFWNGDNAIKGNNIFRQFILAHHTWKINGKPTIYPICTGFNWSDPYPCNEYSCLTSDFAIALVKRYKQFKLIPDVFWLDAGWYSHSGDAEDGKDWANTVGYWTPDSTRFPQGLRPVADEVHKAGAKFMVWFEPERVINGTDWANQHPQWMLHKKSNKNTFLFNLGNPDACKWLCNYMGNFLQQNGIDYYRQDCNINLANYWSENDEPGRQGMCEVKYITGLYTYWDYLLTRFPGLLIDNCASGGRRLDLETTSRSAPLWRTDYSYGEPNGYQCHTYGLEYFLPLHGTGTGLKGTDRFTFRSSLSTSVVYSWKVTQSNYSIPEMHALQAEFKEVRPYFYEDYYPLSGIDNLTSNSIWLAYQLYRPSDDSGFIVAFRRKDNLDKTYTVRLSGISTSKNYILTDKDTGKSIVKTGKELSEGYILTLDKPQSSLLIKYQASK